MPQAKSTILLMSGGCLVGQNVFACLAPYRTSLRLVATNSEANEPTLFDYDSVYLTPPTQESSDDFNQRIEEILEYESPDLIIPCRDMDVLVLAHMRAHRPTFEWPRFLCGNVETARAMLDKMLSFQFALSHDLPFAATIGLDAPTDQLMDFAQKHRYPLLAKPRDGFASRGVLLILNQDQLATARKSKAYILQEYLGNPAQVFDCANGVVNQGLPLFYTLERSKHSIQVAISPGGMVSEPFVTCNKMVFGKSERVSRDDVPEIQELGILCGKAFALAGWRGPLNIQCERNPDGEIKIYEFNGRFTGATAARYLLGHDEVGEALGSFAGISIAPPQVSPSVREVIRLPIGRAINPLIVEQLKLTGFWGDTKIP